MEQIDLKYCTKVKYCSSNSIKHTHIQFYFPQMFFLRNFLKNTYIKPANFTKAIQIWFQQEKWVEYTQHYYFIQAFTWHVAFLSKDYAYGLQNPFIPILGNVFSRSIQDVACHSTSCGLSTCLSYSCFICNRIPAFSS